MAPFRICFAPPFSLLFLPSVPFAFHIWRGKKWPEGAKGKEESMEKRGRGAKGAAYEEEQVKARSCADDRTKSVYSNEFRGERIGWTLAFTFRLDT